MTYKLLITLLIAALLLVCAASLPAADRKAIDDERKASVKSNTVTGQTEATTSANPVDTRTVSPEEITPEEQADMPVRQAMAGEDINWQVITGGGAIGGTSTNYMLSGAVGQTAVGEGGSTSFIVYSGFWQDFAAISNECDVAGDADHSGSVNISDAVYIINYAFRNGAPPYFMNEADANADCALNISDAVYIINYAFRNGAAPICGCVYNK